MRPFYVPQEIMYGEFVRIDGHDVKARLVQYSMTLKDLEEVFQAHARPRQLVFSLNLDVGELQVCFLMKSNFAAVSVDGIHNFAGLAIGYHSAS